MQANLENSAVATGLEDGQFSFQPQRKAIPKNAQTTTQLHSSHMLVMIKILKPGFLECKVKGALGNISRNKASAGDGIPAELFQILKDML